MNPFKVNKALPLYTKRELEKIQKTIAPYLKKSTLFSLLSIPLLSFAFASLYSLLFGQMVNPEMTIIIIVSFIGALGAAFFKESMHYNRSVFKTGFSLIRERIIKSDIASESVRKMYAEKLQQEPFNAMNIFIEFLAHEERQKRREEWSS